MPEDQAPKLPEPSVEIVYPSAQEKKSSLAEFAPEIKAALGKDEEAAKKFAFMVLEGMNVHQKQQFELRNKELDQSHAIAKMRETRIDNETTAKKNTNRLIMGAITFAFAGSLGYGFLHKDTSLADKIFTGAMGILGGAGGLVLTQKKDKE
jgi:transposase